MDKIKTATIVLLITAAISLAGNLVGFKVSPLDALPGIIVLLLLALGGYILAELLPGNIPPVLFIVTVGAIITIPGFPGSAFITETTSKVNFLALATPILAYAGIYTGESTGQLKTTGWKLFIVALGVIVGTYIGSAVIAHFVLSFMGQI